MIYIIAILLFILVLANDTARELLVALIVLAVKFAGATIALVAIVILGIWIFTNKNTANAPLTKPIPQVATVPLTISEIVIVSVFFGGIIAGIFYYLYKWRKNKRLNIQ